MSSITPISLDQACAHSTEEFIWRATLRSSEVIFEQPGLSSDHLPRDQVQMIEYIPVGRKDLPVITCQIDLDKGERFVRYWSNIWQQRKGIQRIYCLGIDRDKQSAMLGFYPGFKKVIVADRHPFQAPWLPESFSLLPPEVLVRGGLGSDHISWVRDGFGGLLRFEQDRLLFSANYE
jgi:hypothetical protein